MSTSLTLASAAYVTANSNGSGCSGPMPDVYLATLFACMCVGIAAAVYGWLKSGKRNEWAAMDAMMYGITGCVLSVLFAGFVALGVEVFT